MMPFLKNCWLVIKVLIRLQLERTGGRECCLGHPSSPAPLANLAKLTRWVSLKEFILHEFPTKPWGCFIKWEGGGLINAGPREALSLKAFFRERHNVCNILLGSLENTNLTSSVRVDTVCEGMKRDDWICLLVHTITICNVMIVRINIHTSLLSSIWMQNSTGEKKRTALEDLSVNLMKVEPMPLL